MSRVRIEPSSPDFSIRSSPPTILQIDRTEVPFLAWERRGRGQEHPFPHLCQEEVGHGAILADMRGQPRGLCKEGRQGLLGVSRTRQINLGTICRS